MGHQKCKYYGRVEVAQPGLPVSFFPESQLPCNRLLITNKLINRQFCHKLLGKLLWREGFL